MSPEPYFVITSHDLTNRGNLTLGQFSQERIAEIQAPSSFGGKLFSQSKIIESNQTLLANHTAYQVVFETSVFADSDRDDSPNRTMEIWTIIGHRVWDLAYVASDIQTYTQHLRTAETMMNTFRFLPEEPTINYQNYIDSFNGFKIRYPAEWQYEKSGSDLTLRPPIATGDQVIIIVGVAEHVSKMDIETYARLNLLGLSEEDRFSLKSKDILQYRDILHGM